MQNNEAILGGLPTNEGPVAYFEKDNFEFLIEQHGYEIIWEKSIACPCKGKGTQHLPSCRNCLGTGWIFINPTQIKAILRSMNLQTKFKDWTEDLIGNISITVSDTNRLNFMDRLTVKEGISMYSQVLFPVLFQDKHIAFLDYPVKKMHEVFMFTSDVTPLRLLTSDEYIIDKTKITFKNGLVGEKNRISVRYEHSPQYYVLEINRDIMIAVDKQEDGSKKRVQMPISAIGRRAHYVIDKSRFESSNLIDNSYIADNCS